MRTKIKLLLPLCILIMLVSSMTVSAGFYGVIDGDVVNVRRYASTNDEVVGKLGYGTPVNVIGYIYRRRKNRDFRNGIPRLSVCIRRIFAGNRL